MGYPFHEIEPRWQQYWDQHKTFRATEDPDKPKVFILDMFPYPSGAGLHVGHPEGYTATDILTRCKRMKGFCVLHPIGWDAFGLPAERYAMQTNIHPRITTAKNIETFRRQIRMLGLSYDWDREVNTTDPDYYRWTQWIFLQIYNSWFDARSQKARPIEELKAELARAGTTELPGYRQLTASEWRGMSSVEQHDFLASFRLAYVDEVPVNWCEALGTVLANEEVAEWTEKGYTVERRPMRQWMMRITTYADRLLSDAGLLDWPNSTLEQQRNWIGKSYGAWIDFAVIGHDEKIRVFTTRPDTIFGATFLVVAPEHPMVSRITDPNQRQAVLRYQRESAARSDLERGAGVKSGVWTGAMARNPASGMEIPIWVADYVLMGYGTGAIMAVPGHDVRDHEFAIHEKLPILEVVSGGTGGEPFEDQGISVNSESDAVSLNGLETENARERIVEWLQSSGNGESAIQYKLRDWLFSRQRYWGEPIPIIHFDDGTMETVPEDELPLRLPDLEKFQPSGTTESPLSLATEWVTVHDPRRGRTGRRETNTMPQWAGSCWYYLRYLDPKNAGEFCSLEKEKYWMPVNLYVGGAEHAVLHLIYARFWHKVLYDLGYVSSTEPFLKLRHQGLILGEDSKKMSKSLGNVVNPDQVVLRYGADAMRLFEMFMGPLEDVKPWSTSGVEGVYRFLNRVWRLFIGPDGNLDPAIQPSNTIPSNLDHSFHTTVKKVTEDIESLRFNTAISQMMIFVNEIMKGETRPRGILEQFVLVLSPFAPHLCEELWSRLGHPETLAYEPWPVYDPKKTVRPETEIILQINGKVRSKLTVPRDTPESELEVLCRDDESIRRYLDGREVLKSIVVKNRLVNLVVH